MTDLNELERLFEELKILDDDFCKFADGDPKVPFTIVRAQIIATLESYRQAAVNALPGLIDRVRELEKDKARFDFVLSKGLPEFKKAPLESDRRWGYADTPWLDSLTAIDAIDAQLAMKARQ